MDENTKQRIQEVMQRYVVVQQEISKLEDEKKELGRYLSGQMIAFNLPKLALPGLGIAEMCSMTRENLDKKRLKEALGLDYDKYISISKSEFLKVTSEASLLRRSGAAVVEASKESM